MLEPDIQIRGRELICKTEDLGLLFNMPPEWKTEKNP
jgi:hypothetical protein